MEHRRLGRTELSVSCVGFGMRPAAVSDYIRPWDAEDPTSQRAVQAALAAAERSGVNLVEVAPEYGAGFAEELLGRFLPGRRDRWIIVGSVNPPAAGWGRLRAEHVHRTVETSLRRLRTDYIDILQFQGDWWRRTDFRPILDDGIPAFRQLRDQGKVRFVGLAAEEPEHLSPFVKTGLFDVAQVRYNILYQGAYDRFIPLARQHDVGVLAMRPLTSGLLDRVLQEAGANLEPQKPAALALSFVLSDPRLSAAVVGLRTPEEVRAAVALGDEKALRFDLEALHQYRVKSPERIVSRKAAGA